jgi:4-amino-4-deoxy-L-arabinose transferase-like glycosyltransferase
VGEPGWLRLLTEPLVGEAGWLLPVALLGIPLALAVLGRPWPPRTRHLALVLWGGWLLPALLYFSLNAGLWHAYYLIMLGPPLAALVGIAGWALWRLARTRPGAALAACAAIAGVTLGVQIGALRDGAAYLAGVLAVAVPLLAGGLVLLARAARTPHRVLPRAGLSLTLLALLVGPALWSALTTLNKDPPVALPRAGPGAGQSSPGGEALAPAQEALLAYLLARTEPDAYLVAALSSHEVSGYILATGRPALALGGFNGADEVVTADELAAMVARGELRYVLGGPELARVKPAIGRWLEASCAPVEAPDPRAAGPGTRPVLYDCTA